MLLLREKSGQAFGDQMAWDQAHHLQVVVGHELIQVSPACANIVFVLYNIAVIMTINWYKLSLWMLVQLKLVQPRC